VEGNQSVADTYRPLRVARDPNAAEHRSSFPITSAPTS